MAEGRGPGARDHLQAAALELIAAARAVLDITEEAIREPDALLDIVVTTARAMAGATGAARAARGRPADAGAPPDAGARPPEGSAGPVPGAGPPETEAGGGRLRPRSGVEHIKIL
jgi:hypothetical protein